MKTGVYKITNLVNGKVYIGASRNIERRWRDHKRCTDSPIHSDLETYGLDNFKFEVLLECPETMLAQWERDMICLYDSDDPEKGYNSKNDRPYSLKLSEARKGIPCSEETKRKMSESHKGKPAWNKGKPAWNKGLKSDKPAWNKGIPCSEETKRKISEAKRLYWQKKKENI